MEEPCGRTVRSRPFVLRADAATMHRATPVGTYLRRRMHARLPPGFYSYTAFNLLFLRSYYFFNFPIASSSIFTSFLYVLV